MHSFYIPTLDQNSNQCMLSEDESKHACRVLRLKQGDQVHLLNGKGIEFVAEITNDHPKRCELTILSFEIFEADKKEIHLAVAPTKNMDRMEWFVEKACELGLTELSFIRCANSERKQLKLDRIEKILVSAMKQSKRKYIPIVHELIDFKQFIEKYPAGAIAHCYDNAEKKNLNTVFQSSNYPILIGPEGDFSLEEIQFIRSKNYDLIDLGKNRLRTETAALFACAQAVLID